MIWMLGEYLVDLFREEALVLVTLHSRGLVVEGKMTAMFVADANKRMWSERKWKFHVTHNQYALYGLHWFIVVYVFF